LKGLSERTGSHIYGKAEFQNPGGSVKDRAALGVVLDAEASGRYYLLQNIGALSSCLLFSGYNPEVQ